MTSGFTPCSQMLQESLTFAEQQNLLESVGEGEGMFCTKYSPRSITTKTLRWLLTRVVLQQQRRTVFKTPAWLHTSASRKAVRQARGAASALIQLLHHPTPGTQAEDTQQYLPSKDSWSSWQRLKRKPAILKPAHFSYFRTGSLDPISGGGACESSEEESSPGGAIDWLGLVENAFFLHRPTKDNISSVNIFLAAECLCF